MAAFCINIIERTQTQQLLLKMSVSFEVLAVVFQLVELGVFELDVLLQRALGSIAPITELGITIILSLYFLGSPAGALVQLPLRLILPLLQIFLDFLMFFAFVKRGELCLYDRYSYIYLNDLDGKYFLQFVLLPDFGGQFEGSQIDLFKLMIVFHLYVGFNIGIFQGFLHLLQLVIIEGVL